MTNIRLGILRFAAYTVFVALVAWLVYQAGIRGPGGMQLALPISGDSEIRTTEYSLVELLQNLLLLFCVVMFTWVGFRDRLRRPLAVSFVALFLLGLIRELDFFLDWWVADNFWQVVAGLVGVPAGVYLARHRQRLVAGWQRSWPSAGLAIVMAGLMLLVPFSQILSRPALWEATLGEGYQRVAMLAFEELSELGAYLVITIGTMEFLYTWSRLPQTREMDRPRRPRRRR